MLGPPARFRLAARALALGVPVRGSRLPARSAALRGDRDALGRRDRDREARREDGRHRPRRRGCSRATGGSSSSPWGAAGRPSPSSSRSGPTVADLLELSRAGRHAASDHLETAALTGLPTVGCRRCGGGLAGAVGHLERPRRRAARGGARSRPDRARRERRSDPADRRRPADPRRRRPPGCGGRDRLPQPVPRPARRSRRRRDGRGRRRARRPRRGVRRADATRRPDRAGGAAAAPARRRARPEDRLLRHGAGRTARHGSPRISRRTTAPRSPTSPGSLSDRAALRAELAHLDADVVVVEIKAAAIDVVAEEAARLGIPVVLAANDVVPLPGEPDLDVELERLAAEAISSAVVGV